MSAEPGRIGATEWKRKAVHIGSGLFALLLAWLPIWGAWLMAAAALALNLFLLPGLTARALERPGERAAGKAWGIIFYPLSVLILTLACSRRMEIAAAAWGFMAFGDGLATLFGKALPRPRLPWNRDKSVAGSLSLLVFGALTGWGLYLWTAAGHGRGPDPWAALAAVAGAAAVAALLESLPTGVDDNLLVPLAGAAALYGFTLIDPGLAAGRLGEWGTNLVVGLVVNLAVGGAALRARAVNGAGFAAGLVIGTAIFTFGGWRGYLMLLAFFVIGSATTRIGYGAKAAAGIAQSRGGRRGAENALANCGAGVVLALLAAATPYGPWLWVAFVAAFATAAFDTASSEIGQVYGRRTVLITTLRPVPRGTEGAVSLEGTLAGLGAALALALLALAVGLLPPAGVAAVAGGAFVGAMGESYLGAGLESVKLIDNEMVNFLNTLVGAAAALALAAVLL